MLAKAGFKSDGLKRPERRVGGVGRAGVCWGGIICNGFVFDNVFARVSYLVIVVCMKLFFCSWL